MNILNLYSGIGGNREMWGDDDNITAIELDVNIAAFYKKRFPNDTVIATDAHSYLLENYKKFDFIWGSLPCQSHGQYRHNIGVKAKGYKPLYIDMTLYQEILFLQTYFSGGWCIENTIPYYKALIKPSAIIQRHTLWSNFWVPRIRMNAEGIRTKNKLSDFGAIGEAVSKTGIKNKRQCLRNMLNPVIGLHVMQTYKEALKDNEAL